METDAPTTVPRIQVVYKVHPLVLLNISEHWTRVKSQRKDRKPEQVFGAILGVNDGKEVEVHNSFAVPYEMSNEGFPIIDEEYCRTRIEQYQQVFPELHHLGWYTTGGEGQPTAVEMAVHRQFSQWSDSILLAKLDTNMSSQAQDKLPLYLLESAPVDLAHDAASSLRAVEWTLVSEESERIGVDHVTKLSQACTSATSGKSEVAKQIRSTAAAAEMLRQRMKIVHSYLGAVREGRLPPNQEILALANKLVQQLPLLETDDFERQFEAEATDVNAALLVTEMVKVCGAMNNLQTRMSVLAMERPNIPGGGKPSYRSKAMMQQMHHDLFTI